MISRRSSYAACLSVSLVLVGCGGGGSGGKAAASVDGGSGGSGANNGGGSGATSSAGGKMAGGGGGGGGMRPTPGPFVPPMCSADSSMALPEGAPVLEPGIWKDISPPARFNMPPGNFTQGMTIDPCNPATLYVCVVSFEAQENNGLYRSTDAGSTWTRLGDHEFPIRVRVDPNDPNHLYAVNGVSGGTHGFYVSTDGGETWAIPAGFRALAEKELLFDAYHVEPDPADFNHLLVTFHNGWRDEKYNGNSGIIESFDGGDTWTVHLPPNPGWAGGYNVFFLYDPEQGIGDANTWLFGTQGDGYWRTADAGVTWKKVSNINMDHGGGSIYYSPDGVLYASGAPSILRSEDNGETWTETQPTQFTAFLTIVGDGNQLYTSPHFGGEVKTASATSADPEWTQVGDYPSAFKTSGAFEMVVDPHNRILYTASTGAGVWALKLP